MHDKFLKVRNFNSVGSCSALGGGGGHYTLSGHNFYGENYIPMEGHQNWGAPAPLAPLVPTPMRMLVLGM